ncbi:MAG: tetratricopeptide repeat protein [Lewinella sp.]|nr:tetratricopeptide repeat protein [Lewinella sp.]
MQWLRQTRRLGLGLFILSVLLYANTFGHQYAQDDLIVIAQNKFTTQGTAGLADIFKYDTFYGFFYEEGKDKLVAGGRYRPLSLAFFALEYELFGDRPQVMHVLNALWYGGTVVVLYGLLLALFSQRRTFDKKLSLTAAYLIPLLAAVIFAVHPIHTEVVANIKGRDEILSLLGSLGALWLLLGWTKHGRWWYPVAAALCFFAGLLSKENAITYLGVAPLALYLFTRQSIGQVALRTLPLLLAAGLFLLIRGSILGWDLGEPSRELMNNPFLVLENGSYVDMTDGEKSATITYTLGRYVQLLLVPHPLTHDYYPRHVAVMHWGQWQVLLSLLLYLGLLAWGAWSLWRRQWPSWGIWAYLLPLFIVSNIIFPVGTNMSERFLFMPSVGFALLAAGGLYWLWQRKATLAWAAAGGITLIFAVLTLLRNPAWENNYTLFTTDIQTSANSAKLRNAVGGELIAQWTQLPADRREARKSMLTEAIGHLDEALRIHPGYAEPYFLKGKAYYFLEDYPAAITALQEAVNRKPGDANYHQMLMIAYRDTGKYYGEQMGDLNTALQYLQQAYQGMPNDYETIRLLGVAYGVGGNNEKAIEYFRMNTDNQPDNARAWFDLGTAYYQAGRLQESDAALQRARQLDPEIDSKVRGEQ